MWPQAIVAAVFALASLLRRSFLPAVSRSRAATWREAAAAVGLSHVELTAQGLSGRKGGLLVHLTRFDRRDAQGTCVRISGPALAPTLTLRSEGLDSAWRRRRGWQEIEVGDEAFDRAVWVEGPPLVVRAVLDRETRGAVLALLDGRLERPRLQPFWAKGRLAEGVLSVELPEARAPVDETSVFFEFAFAAGGLFSDGLRGVIALAERLATPRDVPRRLAEKLRCEPLASVRERCLTTLVREAPDHPATREALVAAREDPDAGVRLRAGVALGPEGRDVLLQLALGEGAEDATTEQAVSALGAELTIEEATAILRGALRSRRETTAGTAMSVLARLGGAAAVQMIARVLAVEHGPLACTAADSLGRSRSPLAEGPLLAALGSADAHLRRACLRALGAVGSVAAVAPLRELESGDSAVRSEARQAIARIQARQPGASPGQLSLAGGEAGELSLADGEAGRLSFAGERASDGPAHAPDGPVERRGR